MINRLKKLNWTAIITWGVILYVTFLIWNYILF